MYIFFIEDTKNNSQALFIALDMEWNAIYGLFLAIWGSVFCQSYFEKEKIIVHRWDLKNSNEMLIDDERKGDYTSHVEYNYITNTKMNRSESRNCVMYFNYVYNLFMVVVIVTFMIVFEEITYDEVDAVNADSVANNMMQDFFDLNTIIYGLIIEAIGFINEKVIMWFVINRNFQYKTEFNDSLALQMFAF
jgi:hypothetical protein